MTTYPPDVLQLLRDRINLTTVPFTDRGSRIMLFGDGETFNLKLVERWAAWEREYGHYRRRPPFVRDFALLGDGDVPLPYRPVTYPHAVEVQTAAGLFRWMFVDEETLVLQLPPGPGGARFRVLAARGRADRRGGEFKGGATHGETRRNLAYTTNARIASNEVAPSADGYLQVTVRWDAGTAGASLQLNLTPRLSFNRALRPPANVAARAEERWRDWFRAVPPVDGGSPEVSPAQYAYAWWCLRAGLISPRFFITRETLTPSKTYYVGAWKWDAFFHALAYRHVDMRLAEDHLRLWVDHQRADGMLPDAVHDEGTIFEILNPLDQKVTEVTKPPLIAWAALKLFERSGNLDFLQELYEPIARWNEWWFEKNDDDRDGIVQYNHPYCTADDSPLWDEGMPVESPDINTYLVLQMEALAVIAERIGLPQDAPLWRRRAGDLLQKMIAHMWDERAGLFWALRNDQPVRVLTLFNLFPLLTGRLPEAIAARLLEHLLNPDEFWTDYPLPTVARSDPRFNPDQMWRGPTWCNINYLFIEGLVKCGYLDAARALRDRTLALIARHPDMYEYYNPLTGDHPPKAAGIFGWTSAVFADLAIQAAAGKII